MRPYLISHRYLCDFCGNPIEAVVPELNSQIFAFFFCTQECKKKWSLVKSHLVYQRYDPHISVLDTLTGKDDFAGKDTTAGHSFKKDNAGVITGQADNSGDKTELTLKANLSGNGRKYLGLYFSLRKKGN